jgi:hypothetical protein
VSGASGALPGSPHAHACLGHTEDAPLAPLGGCEHPGFWSGFPLGDFHSSVVLSIAESWNGSMKVPKNCAACGTSFEASRSDAQYCSPTCRKAAWKGLPKVQQPTELPGPIARETRTILSRLGVDDSDDVGHAALACAAALDDPSTPPGALVGLSRALPETLEYLRGVPCD